jgi:hydroxyethylthiazole kinase-like uncharacterized protein yjeF
MRFGHAVEKVRAAEQALMARLPDGTLMQRAATGLATVSATLLPRVYGARVLLLIGSGDNGGDALYAGARLARRGAAVEAILAGAKTHEAGLAALRAAGGRVTDRADAIDTADLVIDGLTGIGGRGALREPYAALAAQTAHTTATVVACDVPSGVDAGTGQIDGVAVQADVTVTFGTHKPGLLIDPGASHSGVVELIDIGLGPDLPDPDVVAAWSADLRLPRPGVESDKYRRGVLGLLAGSEQYTGAAVLSAGGAVHGGAGMVRFVSVRPVVDLVRQRWPEVVTTVIEPGRSSRDTADAALAAGRVQAWVVGPGLGTDERAESLVAAALGTELPVLVDADGLTVLARRRDLLRRAAPTVLTPHAGELARLLGAERDDVEARRLEHVRRAAAELSATVLLKGSTTLVAEPDRPVRVNTSGTPWLATAGTGDVLSGLIGALLAGGGLKAIDAAAAGAYLHGLAARLAATGGGHAGDGAAPLGASDVVAALPAALRQVNRTPEGIPRPERRRR